jgi:transposase
MTIPFKKPPSEFNQRSLFARNVFDLLPKEHECYLYNDILSMLDTSKVECKYSRKGQNAYHPKSIVSILIYSYIHGVFSSRQIEKRCREDLPFMFISQMNCPNFRVLSDFRKDNSDFFHDCFKQSVMLALELGLVSFGHVSLDGSKFKANTSKHKAMSYKRLKEKEDKLTEEITSLIEKANKCDEEEDLQYKDKTGYEVSEDLKFKEERLNKIKAAKAALEEREKEKNPEEQIDDKKQISFSDPDACIMPDKGSFGYNYNAQISVDEDNQIIVGQHLSQNANDKKELEPALNSIKNTVGELPSKLSADNGYMSGDNLEILELESLDAYIATDRSDKKKKQNINDSTRNLERSDFSYDEQNDCFICPAGHRLPLKSESTKGEKRYQAEVTTCNACKLKNRCCYSMSCGRTIKTDSKEHLRRKMSSKMEDKDSKAVYKKRKEIVEPVFGQIKNRGFRGFSLRGYDKTSGEFSLVCAAHNFVKILRYMGSVISDLDGNEMTLLSV